MVSGILNFYGDEKIEDIKTIQDCDLVLVIGMKTMETGADQTAIDIQRILLDGGISLGGSIECLAASLVDAIAELSEGNLAGVACGIEMLKSEIDKASRESLMEMLQGGRK